MQSRIVTSVFQMRKGGSYLLKFVLICLLANPIFAIANTNPLPADKAFNFSVSIENPNSINVHWNMVKDYYLYKQKVHFTFDPSIETDIRLPQGQMKQDPNH